MTVIVGQRPMEDRECSQGMYCILSTNPQLASQRGGVLEGIRQRLHRGLFSFMLADGGPVVERLN